MRIIFAFVWTVLIFTIYAVSPAFADYNTVLTRPTPKTMAAGESVYFDDKKCPAGQIAKFTKAQRREEVRRKCVAKSGG